jgi:hypothetical protein
MLGQTKAKALVKNVLARARLLKVARGALDEIVGDPISKIDLLSVDVEGGRAAGAREWQPDGALARTDRAGGQHPRSRPPRRGSAPRKRLPQGFRLEP